MPQAVEAFRAAGSSEDILLRLSTLTGAPLIKHETLIFFDEVQLCPEIVTAIKFLERKNDAPAFYKIDLSELS